MKTITIYMEGGLIQHIENIPKGTEIRVLDFDTDDSGDDPRVQPVKCNVEHFNGKEAYEQIW